MHPGSIPGEASNPSRHFGPRAPSSGRSRKGEARNDDEFGWTQRLRMVNSQLRTSDVTDMSVLAAFVEVPRERFVAPALMNLAYVDQDVPAAGATDGRRLLAPRTLALLLQAAATGPGDRALDVGGGSGYSAALLDHIGASVVSVESDRGASKFAREALAGRAGIRIVEGDLAAAARARGAIRRHTRQRRLRDDAERVAGPTRRLAAAWSASMRARVRRAA